MECKLHPSACFVFLGAFRSRLFPAVTIAQARSLGSVDIVSTYRIPTVWDPTLFDPGCTFLLVRGFPFPVLIPIQGLIEKQVYFRGLKSVLQSSARVYRWWRLYSMEFHKWRGSPKSNGLNLAYWSSVTP